MEDSGWGERKREEEEQEGNWLVNRKILNQDIMKEVEVKEEEEEEFSFASLALFTAKISRIFFMIKYVTFPN